MGFLTVPVLGVSILGVIFTVRFIQALDATRPEAGFVSLRDKLHELAGEHPAAGMNHGIKVEIIFLILAVVADGLECLWTFSVLLIDLFSYCSKDGLDDPLFSGMREQLAQYAWKAPDITYGSQVMRLIVLGSIWNKGAFYGLFCWRGGAVLRWQEVGPHLLELLAGAHSSPLGVPPRGDSRSGLPNTCTYDDVANSIRGTLLLSFVTFFVVLPASYAGCLWNFERGSLSCGGKVGYGLVTAWGFVWALVTNFLINVKVMLSLGALLSVQAFYLGIDDNKPFIFSISACLVASGAARNLWVMMQSILRQTMFELGLVSEGPPESNRVVDNTPMMIAGFLSIVLYIVSAGQLKHSSILRADLAVGITWLDLLLADQ
ncbi:hypothetical protein KFL_002220030 [Klebsormidium nitens]|uniref:Uncharacterized protein n=1 Tax=Klebsormidium nitens TaxID=105231 RepID=A0A1Y1I6W1_KLENI|nr:hypothetical protein KFL_002220030 [Klebsormidium nitens]|eukprot:GAQ85159.1 hypothetical protein KFL_002220030 [Klebsormidium nitens]